MAACLSPPRNTSTIRRCSRYSSSRSGYWRWDFQKCDRTRVTIADQIASKSFCPARRIIERWKAMSQLTVSAQSPAWQAAFSRSRIACHSSKSSSCQAIKDRGQGKRFERRPYRQNQFAHVIRRRLRNPHRAVRQGFEQPFVAELCDCLANGRAADAETIDQFLLDQPFALANAARQQVIAQLLDDLLAQPKHQRALSGRWLANGHDGAPGDSGEESGG